MTKQKGIKLALLIVAVALIAQYSLWITLLKPFFHRLNRGADYHEASVEIACARIGDSHMFPSNLDAIAREPQPYRRAGHKLDWSNFYYVAGLTPTDADWIPILIAMPKPDDNQEAAVFRLGGGFFFTTTQVAQRLIARPWDPSGYGTDSWSEIPVLSEADKSNLATRLKVLPPLSQTHK